MPSFHDIQLALKAAMATGAANAWAFANAGGKTLTIFIGDRMPQPEQLPCVIIIHEPGPIIESSSLFEITDNYALDCGTHNDDPETAIAQLAALSQAVMVDVLADRTLGGIVTDTLVQQALGDKGGNHPFHFYANKISTIRKEKTP